MESLVSCARCAVSRSAGALGALAFADTQRLRSTLLVQWSVGSHDGPFIQVSNPKNPSVLGATIGRINTQRTRRRR
jgi:hypothetical protein